MRTIALSLSLVLIFMIPWEGMIHLPGLGTAAKFVGLVVGAFWLATVITTDRLRKPGPFHIAVSLFVLWNAASVFWSADIDSTVARLATWVQLLVLVFILWDLYTTRAALLAGLQAYVLGAYVAIGSAVSNFFSGNVFYTNYQRFSPGDTNPDGFGFIVALGIPVAWYLASLKSTNKMGHFLKLVNYAYIPAAFFGIALSGTRTAMIASLIGVAFGLVSLKRLRLVARIAILVLLISAIFILLPVVQPLTSFQRLSTTGTELTEGDLNQRTGLWQDGLASFAEHPLLGVGSNTYRSVNRLDKIAHNSFLSVLVEVGLIGFILFGLILTIVVIQAWRQPKWEAGFWLTTLVVWAIGASTLTWEHRKTTWLFLSLVIASAALASQRHKAGAHIWRNQPGGHFLPHTRHRQSASLTLEVPQARRHPIEARVGTYTSALALNQENDSITETKGPVFNRRRTPQDEIMENLALVAQGNRLSSVVRVKGHKKDTILAWIREAAEHAEVIEAALSADYQIERGQLDTLWAYADIEETAEPASSRSRGAAS